MKTVLRDRRNLFFSTAQTCQKENSSLKKILCQKFLLLLFCYWVYLFNMDSQLCWELRGKVKVEEVEHTFKNGWEFNSHTLWNFWVKDVTFFLLWGGGSGSNSKRHFDLCHLCPDSAAILLYFNWNSNYIYFSLQLYCITMQGCFFFLHLHGYRCCLSFLLCLSFNYSSKFQAVLIAFTLILSFFFLPCQNDISKA